MDKYRICEAGWHLWPDQHRGRDPWPVECATVYPAGRWRSKPRDSTGISRGGQSAATPWTRFSAVAGARRSVRRPNARQLHRSRTRYAGMIFDGWYNFPAPCLTSCSSPGSLRPWISLWIHTIDFINTMQSLATARSISQVRSRDSISKSLIIKWNGLDTWWEDDPGRWRCY